MIWSTVLEISSVTDWNRQLWVIFCPLPSPLKTQKNQNFEKMKNCWRYIILHSCTNRGTVPEIWSETDRTFCHFGPFLPLYPLNNQENQNFKTHLEMSSLYTGVPKITIIWYMLPEIWNMTDNFLSFWVIFCPLTFLTTSKIRILKKWKKTPEDIIILHHLHTTNDDMLYGSWDIKCDRQNFCHFGLFLGPFTSPPL